MSSPTYSIADSEEIPCLTDEVRFVSVNGRTHEFRVHVNLGYLVHVVDKYERMAVVCRHHIYDSYFEMMDILVELKNAAATVLQAIRSNFIDRELQMWSLPTDPEALTAFVDAKISDFRALLQKDLAKYQERTQKIGELFAALNNL
ncbi:unnamed protein product [Auanema sp. JU1783]|nr:unnamed protein product [Auanema sp. JU1783]